MPGVPFTKDDPRINREGRPLASRNFTTKVREALEKIGEGNATSYEEALIKSILHNAIVQKDVQAQRLIWNYLDGMPHQQTDITSGGEKIMVIPSELINKNDTSSKSITDSTG